MKLFLDLGNSRLKTALFEDEVEFLNPLTHQDVLNGAVFEILEIEDLSVENIYICSVASHALTSALIKNCQDVFGLYPVMLTTQPESCGVKCGYEKFETLGVDRWMSIVASAAHSSKPILIVSAGTALTVDVVIDKEHKGGFIVPGIGLMMSSLNKETAQIEVNQLNENGGDGLLATNTENAVIGGVLFMASAYINHLIAELEQETGRRFDCIGTGGDFERIQPMLDKEFQHLEELTIRGMIEVVENC